VTSSSGRPAFLAQRSRLSTPTGTATRPARPTRHGSRRGPVITHQIARGDGLIGPPYVDRTSLRVLPRPQLMQLTCTWSTWSAERKKEFSCEERIFLRRKKENRQPKRGIGYSQNRSLSHSRLTRQGRGLAHALAHKSAHQSKRNRKAGGLCHRASSRLKTLSRRYRPAHCVARTPDMATLPSSRQTGCRACRLVCSAAS